MSSLAKVIVVTGLLVVTLCLNVFAGRKEVVEKTFDAKESIRINTVSGDCIIKQGNDNKIHVHLVYSYSPRGSFEPKFEERSRVLRLSENHYESNSGSSVWTITIPAETRVRFRTASGDFEAADLKADIDIETASGDILLENCTGHFEVEAASGDITAEKCRGEFEFSTASGDVAIQNCTGEFELQTASGDIEVDDCEGEFDLAVASGDIEASGITVNNSSSFAAASGDVEVTLAVSAEHDLIISTASGSVTLDYNGNPIEGQFEFTARLRRGRITAPFDFDDEEEFERWGQDYVRKSFTRGSDSPLIAIETASGRATLKE
ncbi:MAG: DUF4097 family beta strand repeat protein [candidate division Zixibacteria bacterium]|nr:DUF4097 family beta strand repeat protein [candidate division Zixibacteria bacterium]